MKYSFISRDTNLPYPTAVECFLASLVLLAANLFFFYFNTPRRLDLFDMSAFLDAGYRVSIGQRPYLDFYYQAGPGHLWLLAASFLLLGFTLNAVILSVSLCSTLFGVCCYFFSRTFLSVPASFALSLLFSLIFAGPYSHPWYDLTAYALATPALLLCHPRLLPKSYMQTVVAAGLLSLSFLSKSNIGAIAGCWCFCFLLIFSQARYALALVFTFLGCVALLLSVYSLTESIDQCFFSYKVVSRLTNIDKAFDALCSVPRSCAFLAQCLFVIFALRLERRREIYAESFFGLSILTVESFAAYTGSSEPSAHTMMSGLQVISLLRTWFIYRKYELTRSIITQITNIICFLVVLGLAFSGVQKTIFPRVWNWKHSNTTTDLVLASPGFEGWQCSSIVCSGLDDTVRFIKDRIPPNESVLVLPQSTMIYGMAGRESYPGLPFIFHAQVHPAPGKIRDTVEGRFKASPPQWIIIDKQTEHTPSSYMEVIDWMGLTEFVTVRYEEVASLGNFKILKLNHSGQQKNTIAIDLLD